MMWSEFLPIVPLVVVLSLSLLTRKVLVALVSGVCLGVLILLLSKDFLTVLSTVFSVLSKGSMISIFLFCLLIGAWMEIIKRLGGIEIIVRYLITDGYLVRSSLGAQLFVFAIGLLLFVDGYFSVVIAGVIGVGLFDRYHISRSQLAYILDATSSPVAWLIPVNAAGTFVVALMKGMEIAQPWQVLFDGMIFQFYSILSIFIVFILILLSQRNSRQMPAVLNEKSSFLETKTDIGDSKKIVLLPLLLLIPLFFLGILVVGDAIIALDISLFFCLMITAFCLRKNKFFTTISYMGWCWKGAKSFVEITIVLALAFVLGNILKELNMEILMMKMFDFVSPSFLPLMTFVLGVFLSLSTGTSGGTVAIILPIVFPLALRFGVDLPVLLGAAISGSVFGDHCSPLSDSTILASKIADIEVMEHVRFQIPYAFLAATLSMIGYFVLGFNI